MVIEFDPIQQVNYSKRNIKRKKPQKEKRQLPKDDHKENVTQNERGGIKMAVKRGKLGTFFFPTREAAETKRKELKLTSPAAWSVLTVGKKIFLGARSGYSLGWNLFGGGWMKETIPSKYDLKLKKK